MSASGASVDRRERDARNVEDAGAGARDARVALFSRGRRSQQSPRRTGLSAALGMLPVQFAAERAGTRARREGRAA